MNGTNKLRYGTSRVDARLLLAMLDHISTHGGVAAPELGKILSLSRATVIRMIANSRDQYGVIITWRQDNSMPSHGEYSVDDWGVFDQSRVIDFANTCLRSRRNALNTRGKIAKNRNSS